MPHRPMKEKSNSTDGPAPWLGYQDAKILNFESKPDAYDWADVYLEVEIKTRNSEYSNKLIISGSFDKEDDSIVENSLLRKMYSLFDALGFGGGIDKEGKWVNKIDEPIEDIATFLNNNYTDNTDADIYPFCVYVYKHKVTNKNTAEENVYTRIVPRIARADNPKGVADFKSYIDWAKKNEVIVEHTEDDLDFLKSALPNGTATQSPSINNIG